MELLYSNVEKNLIYIISIATPREASRGTWGGGGGVKLASLINFSFRPLEASRGIWGGDWVDFDYPFIISHLKRKRKNVPSPK